MLSQTPTRLVVEQDFSHQLGYGKNPTRYSELDRQYLWHPFTHLPTWLDESHLVRTIVRGEGAYLIDSEGRRLHDANASIWSNVHGHSHPHLTAAIENQIKRFAHSSFLGFSHPPGIEFARCLVEGPLSGSDLNRVFFAESGANAIEAALRMSLQWQRITAQPQRRRIVNFRHSYHGDTLGALSVTGLGHFYHHSSAIGYEVVTLGGSEELDQIEDPESIAAVIFEPLVAGAAGILPWPRGMMRQTRDWCDKNGSLLIFDEIFTGFGRTAKTLFAFQQESVVPDLLVLGKAITSGTVPLSAVIVQDHVFAPFSQVSRIEDSLLTGHTYAANPTACAAAIASLHLFEREQTLANAGARAEQIQKSLPSFQELPVVRETRQVGLACAIELHDPENPSQASYGARIGLEAASKAYDHGVLIRNIGPSLILCPQLSIQKDTLADLLERLHQSLSALKIGS